MWLSQCQSGTEMGIEFLPWEKWLPPFIYGPLMCVGSILVLCFSHPFRWWEALLLPCATLLGAWATWVWFKEGRNIFKEATDGPPSAKADDSSNESGA
jgi:hypothetical protein